MKKIDITVPEKKLRARIKAYRKKSTLIKKYLDANPIEWGRYQSDFNQEINAIFRELMIFEKTNLEKGREEKVYKLKNLFVKFFRKDFIYGDMLKWSLDKPYEYAGDHVIMDQIYRNAPRTLGYERLYDNYYQMSAICIAVRNRKEDFKRFVLAHYEKFRGKKFRVMNLASGPCRDIYELLNDYDFSKKGIEIYCVDSDKKALEYGKNLIGDDPRVKFVHQNAVRIALKKNPKDIFGCDFDFIFSMGLFDYLDDRITIRLINSLRKLLKKNSTMAIADVRDKFSNPSIYFMEWVADWNLLYREDDAFRKLFVEAGYNEKLLRYEYEQQGVIQYVVAKNQ